MARRPPRRGMTLVETLMVVGIISLLIQLRCRRAGSPRGRQESAMRQQTAAARPRLPDARRHSEAFSHRRLDPHVGRRAGTGIRPTTAGRVVLQPPAISRGEAGSRTRPRNHRSRKASPPPHHDRDACRGVRVPVAASRPGVSVSTRWLPCQRRQSGRLWTKRLCRQHRRRGADRPTGRGAEDVGGGAGLDDGSLPEAAWVAPTQRVTFQVRRGSAPYHRWTEQDLPARGEVPTSGRV